MKVIFYRKKSCKLIRDEIGRQAIDTENEHLDYWRKMGRLRKLQNTIDSRQIGYHRRRGGISGLGFIWILAGFISCKPCSG